MDDAATAMVSDLECQLLMIERQPSGLMPVDLQRLILSQDICPNRTDGL